MAKIRYGVIGIGSIAPAHLQAVIQCDDTELAAIADSDEQWVKFAAEKYGAKRYYTDYRGLLADPEIDAVSVCVPNRFHAQVTIDALLAGKDVLCEKPMAVSAEEGAKMIAARDKSGRQLMIGQNQRFIPPAQIMKKMYEAGDFGDVYHIRTGWRRPLGMMPSPEDKRENGQMTDRNWYNDLSLHGGVLRDLGVHMLDLALFVTGFPRMTDAFASCYRRFEPDVPQEIKDKYNFTSEDLCSALIKFDNGMSVNLEVSFASAISHEAVFTNIYGTKAGAERSFDDLDIIDCHDGVSFEMRKADLSNTKPFNHCVFEFADALKNNRPVPVMPEEAMRVLEILDRIYETSGFRI